MSGSARFDFDGKAVLVTGGGRESVARLSKLSTPQARG